MRKLKKRIVATSATVVTAAAIAAAVGTTIPKTSATPTNQIITPNVVVQTPESSSGTAGINTETEPSAYPVTKNENKKPADTAPAAAVRNTDNTERTFIVSGEDTIMPINTVVRREEGKPDLKPSEEKKDNEEENPVEDTKSDDKEKPTVEQPGEPGGDDKAETPGDTGKDDIDEPSTPDEGDKTETDPIEEAKKQRLEELAVALGIAEEALDEAKAVQVLAALDENKALEEYTSAKAAVITAREDLDRFVKEHDDAIKEEASYQKILDAKKAVLDAAVTEYNEVVEKYELVSAYTDANNAYQTAAENLEDALNKKSEATAAVEKATSEYQEAVDAKTSADLVLITATEKKESAEQELKEAKAARDQAVAVLVSAKGNNAEAQKALQEANQAVETARGNADAAKEKYEAAQEASAAAGVSVTEAQKAYDNACAALQEAQAVIAQGTLGFFNSNAGSENNEAAEVLNYVFEMQEEGINRGIKVNGEELIFKEHMYTNLGAENDTTNLDNMRRSIELMKELNAIRAGEGLEPLKVTDAMMAISEVQANIEYGLYVDYNQFMHNSGITAKYGVGENMAGITSETTDPFIGWYYDEKAVSEYMGEHGISNAYNAYKQMLDEGYDFRGYSVSSLGHYKNILKDYEITGMGVRYKEADAESIRKSGIATNNFAKLYGDETAVTYTVEEYEALFEDYYQKVNGDVATAQESVDKAKAELDAALAAESDAAEVIAKLATAETEYSNALKDLADAEANAAVKAETAEQTQAVLDEATVTADVAESTVQEAETDLEIASTEFDEATMNAADAQTALDTAEEVRRSAEETLDETETEVAEKQVITAETEEELTQAIASVSELSEEEIESATEAVDEAKEKVDGAQTKVDEATGNVEAAQQKVQETETAVEAGTQTLEEAETKETQAKESYEEATKARKEADADVEKKEKEVGEIKESIEGVDTMIPIGFEEATRVDRNIVA